MKREEIKEEESSKFIEVRKEDLEGGGVVTCAGAFDCFHH